MSWEIRVLRISRYILGNYKSPIMMSSALVQDRFWETDQQDWGRFSNCQRLISICLLFHVNSSRWDAPLSGTESVPNKDMWNELIKIKVLCVPGSGSMTPRLSIWHVIGTLPKPVKCILCLTCSSGKIRNFRVGPTWV